MKKLFKLTTKLIVLYLPFMLLNLVYKNCDVLKKKYDLMKFDSLPENIEIANLGSSHGYIAFDYSIDEFSSMTCFNFALQQQTLDFDSAILRQYIDKFRKNSTLIICLSPFETNGIPNYETDITSKLRYYDFLNPKHFNDFSYKEYFSYKYLSIFTSPHPMRDIKNALSNKFFQSKTSCDLSLSTVTQNSLNNEQFNPPYKKNYADVSTEERINQAEKLIDHWTKIIPPSAEGKSFNLKHIDNIISLCKEKEIKTVVVTTPISREVFDALATRKEYYDLFEFMKELSDMYSETKFLNYTELFFDFPYLLGDNNHLNKTGAREFSKTLHHDMENLGLIK